MLKISNPRITLLASCCLLLGLLAADFQSKEEEGTSPSRAHSTTFSLPKDFWETWSDGKAEISRYKSSINRYGEAREAISTMIFVTEDFSAEQLVKSHFSSQQDPDRLAIIKLNFVEDFQTGVYDYNTMQSSFVTLNTTNSFKKGDTVKVSASSQEWCGNLYAETLFREKQISSERKSYFEGESVEKITSPNKEHGLSEASLFLWARGLAAPRLSPGESMTVPIWHSELRTMLQHKHKEEVWGEVELSLEKNSTEISSTIGKIRTRIAKAKMTNGLEMKIYVEEASPHRIIRWEQNDGYSGEIENSQRIAYWKFTSNADKKKLGR